MKKSFKALLAAALVVTMIPAAAFANSNGYAGAKTIQTQEELSQAIMEAEKDGVFTEAERNTIINAAGQETVKAYITQMLENGLVEISSNRREIEMVPMSDGTEYCRQVYELNNGCSIVMEFEDGEEGLKSYLKLGKLPAINLRASNGETMWKSYGNRYFTATATAVTGVGVGTISLENHYILSTNGIDENYGIASKVISGGNGISANIDVVGVYITDASARTVGASDVNMYGRFNVRYLVSGSSWIERIIDLSTTVGYVDHNYSTGQIKVRHSWSRS